MIARSIRSPRPGAWGWLVLGLVLLNGTLLPRARAQSPGRIPWRTDFASALAESRARNLPMWVQFTGPWCPHCQRMERETFAQPEIVSLASERTIPVKLQSDLHEDLTERFEITGLPATVIVSPSGAVLAHHEGFEPARAFKTILDQALAKGPRPAGKADELALGGYCPVTLVTRRKLERGDAGLSIEHEGQRYRFASPASLQAFRQHPETYSPANSGRCPVRLVESGQAVAGDPHFGVVYGGKLYLCADDAARQRFVQDPRRYARPLATIADAGFCPHCKAESGLLVRGLPRYSTTHAGRVYLFPDPTHLAAFEADPDKYLR